MTNNKFTFICKITCNYWQVYVGTNTYRCSKYFGLKYRVTVAELQIVIPFLLGYKYTLFVVIYVHDRKHE